MGDNRDQEFLSVLSARGALEILKFMDERDEVQHRQMKGIINTHTLNIRIRELLEFELIQHHLEKSEKRHEWYTLTEKGKKVLDVLEILISLAGHSTQGPLLSTSASYKRIKKGQMKIRTKGGM